MTKLILFVGLLSVAFSSFTQNKSYQVIYDSIYPLLNSDYEIAKEKWICLKKVAEIDPAETLLFLGYSLQNGDLLFYKKEIVKLLKDYGWNYTLLDTTFSSISGSKLLEGISENKLAEWTYKKSQKFYPKWEKKHPTVKRYTSLINSITRTDQMITQFVPRFIDSLCVENKEWTNKLIATMDLDHILEIKNLCEFNDGKMLNNFDNGIGVYYKISLILWHNLKTKENFHKAWDLLSYFFDEAYFDGKISYTYLMAYDKWSNFHYGVQYFGTLGEAIEIKDLENYAERKLKYKL